MSITDIIKYEIKQALCNLVLPPGIAGEKILLRGTDDYIQYKYENDTTWINLISLVNITGANGRDIEMTVIDTTLSYRLQGDVPWIPLYDFSNVTVVSGPQGPQGEQGIQGETGAQGSPGVQGPAGSDGANGIDGADGISIIWLGSLSSAPISPNFNNAYYNTTTKQSEIWDGSSWQIIAIDGIDGTNGINGTNGIDGINGTNGTNGTDGRTPEFRENGGKLQYRLIGDSLWIDLYTFPTQYTQGFLATKIITNSYTVIEPDFGKVLISQGIGTILIPDMFSITAPGNYFEIFNNRGVSLTVTRVDGTPVGNIASKGIMRIRIINTTIISAGIL